MQLLSDFFPGNVSVEDLRLLVGVWKVEMEKSNILLNDKNTTNYIHYFVLRITEYIGVHNNNNYLNTTYYFRYIGIYLEKSDNFILFYTLYENKIFKTNPKSSFLLFTYCN